ncbi:GntR family transcriptional regulator [Shimia marina]|uniref:HTH-type transcriptional regulator McbR n=1 Tax=Shimia marina TaxID=321267 RepID=A0A0P1FBQ1_9RHOB|nr:GntR family transcriptional regulator [Shimia marina]CUH51382.1 HTH-type transcriptional regulator McbR [Shimia marina]SFD50546.1 DNA-binding transcriptional regulator, GntR family [Shimia marina]
MEGTGLLGQDTEQNSENTPRVPVHQQVYAQLREAVLFGDLAPGQAVTIQGLIERTGAGMTPIREAIRRLTSEGALEFRGNRRVVVPLLTEDVIDDLIFLRESVESRLAMQAAEKITPSEIMTLEGIDAKLDEAILRGDVAAYLKQNYAFHAGLYAIAKAPILMDVANSLWLRFGPSMRMVCGRMGTQSLPDNHKSALDALHKKDAQAAGDALREDVVQGIEQIRAALLDGSGLSDVID